MKPGETPVLRYFLSSEAKALEIALKIPRDDDAGFDLPALRDVIIPAGGFALIPTGLHLAIPINWLGLIRDRSSVALRGGCVVAGVIDSSYRGEVKVAMHNLGKEPLEFQPGARIAQLLIIPHLPGKASARVEYLEELGDSERGEGGFGSTGV